MQISFPSIFRDHEEIEHANNLLNISNQLINKNTGNDFDLKVIDSFYQYMLELKKPLNVSISDSDSFINSRKRSFGKLCSSLQLKAGPDPEYMTSFKFWSLVDVINSES